MERFFFLSTTQYRWGAALWTLAILAACSLPATSLASVEPTLPLDKLAHFGLFVIFGSLWMRVLCPPDATASWGQFRREGGRLLVLGGLFAGASEVYQHLIPVRRMADPYDALADGLGLLVGIVLYAGYVRWQSEEDLSSVQ